MRNNREDVIEELVNSILLEDEGSREHARSAIANSYDYVAQELHWFPPAIIGNYIRRYLITFLQE